MAVRAGRERFLRWFRQETERRWRAASWPLGATGLHAPLPRWLRRSTWGPPLSDAVITALEARWGITYPQDVRRFLRTVHAQRRRRSFSTADDEGPPRINKVFVLYDQLRDAETIATARATLLERMHERLASGEVWLEEWGTRPRVGRTRARQALQALAAAPRLVPMALHTFVVSGAEHPTSPVFCLHPHDLYLWCKAATWEAYLLDEFTDFLGTGVRRYAPAIRRAARRPRRVPFWSAFADWCETTTAF